MKTALRRELEAAGWRALGFLGALFLLGVGTVLWGLHIEGRVDRVVVERQHDHRVVERLAQGRPLRPHGRIQISSKEVQNLGLGTEGRAPTTTGGEQPPKGGSTKPPAPGKGGSKGGGAPTKAPEAEPEAPSEAPTSAPAPEPAIPGNPSTSEAPPGLIGNPGGAVGKAACDATEVVNEVAGVRVCGK